MNTLRVVKRYIIKPGWKNTKLAENMTEPNVNLNYNTLTLYTDIFTNFRVIKIEIKRQFNRFFKWFITDYKLFLTHYLQFSRLTFIYLDALVINELKWCAPMRGYRINFRPKKCMTLTRSCSLFTLTPTPKQTVKNITILFLRRKFFEQNNWA